MIMGTITNSKIEENVALVKIRESGSVKAVKLGFRLLDEYRVSEVTTKYILLTKNLMKYLIYQNKFAGEFEKFNKPLPAITNSTPSWGSFSEPGFERKENKITASEAYLKKIISDDLSSVLMQATAIPKIENGTIVGFSLLQIDANSIFDKAGLLDNDVITSVNGQKLNGVSQAIRVLKSAKDQKSIEVEIERNGALQKLEISINS